MTKKLGTATAKNTSPQGRDILQREMDHLQRDWDDCLGYLRQTEGSLEQTMKMWEEYETRFEQINEWLGNMEQKVKGHDLKNTYMEKQTQAEKFKVSGLVFFFLTEIVCSGFCSGTRLF